MKRSLAALLALAVAILLYLVLRGGDGEPQVARGPADPGNTSQTNAATDLAAAEGASARGAVADSSAAPLAAAALEPQPAASPAVDASQLARIRGVALRQDRTPIADGRLVLHRRVSNRERASVHGRVSEGAKIETSTNSNGSFEVAFATHPVYSYELDLSAPWVPSVEWAWRDLAPGSVVDIGVVVLPLGGRIEGRVVDERGAAPGGGWMVGLVDNLAGPLRPDVYKYTYERCEAPLQTFVFDGVAPGPVELTLLCDVAESAEPRTVEVVAGRTTTVELLAPLSRADERITVAFIDHLSRNFGPPAAEHFALRASDGRSLAWDGRTLKDVERRVFDGLAPGSYVLVVSDPRFRPFESEPIAAGSNHWAQLEGSVDVTFVVTSNGAPVESPTFELRPHGTARQEYEWMRTRRASSNPVPGTFVFHTVPSPQTWRVTAPGFEPREVDFHEGFEIDSSPTQTIELTRGAAITGRVLDSDGAPVAGVEVVARLASGDAPTMQQFGQRMEWFKAAREGETHRALTDGEGHFELSPLTGEYFDVHTMQPAEVCGHAVDVAKGTTGLELVLAPRGRLRGRVEPDFEARARTRLRIETRAEGAAAPQRIAMFVSQRSDMMFSPGEGLWIDVAADGSFHCNDLAVGAHDLFVELPPIEVEMGSVGFSVGAADLPDIAPFPFAIAADATTELAVDITDQLPRSARVHVVDRGTTTTPLQVWGHLYQEHTGPADVPPWQLSAVGRVGEGGIALVGPLVPGRWTFELRPLEGAWRWPIPGEHVVDEALDLEFVVDVEIVSASVTITNPDGSPAAKMGFGVRGPNFFTTQRTDDNGVVMFTMPVGTYVFDRTGRDPAPGQPPRTTKPLEIVWTSGGPAQPVLRLEAVD